MRSIKREIIEIICVTLFATAVTLSLWKSPVIVTALLIVGSLCMFILWHSRGDIIAYVTAFFWNTKMDLYTFLISAIGGVVAEAAAIHLGIWTYPGYFFNRPFKLPISIPIIYGVVGVIVYRASTLGECRLKKK